jgi:hypothetical protein
MMAQRRQNAECRMVVLVMLGFWAQSEFLATTNEVRVRVDAGQIVRTVDARLFDINAVMWDTFLDTPGTLAALRELDVQALRFPGGSPSDDYHWAAGFQPESDARIYSYGIPQDEAARTGTGSPDIAQTAFKGAAVEFPCTFEPYSATLTVLSPVRGK